MGQIGITEAQAVQASDRPGSHGEDIAVDPAYPGSGSLVRFERTGVIVAFDLERARQAVTDVHQARVFLTGPY